MQSGRTRYRSIIWEITQKKDRKSRKLFLMRLSSKTDTEIQKNKGYTDYKRNRHTFAGWDQRADVKPQKRHFRKIAKTEFLMKKLRKLAAYQRQDGQPSKEMAK